MWSGGHVLLLLGLVLEVVLSQQLSRDIACKAGNGETDMYPSFVESSRYHGLEWRMEATAHIASLVVREMNCGVPTREEGQHCDKDPISQRLEKLQDWAALDDGWERLLASVTLYEVAEYLWEETKYGQGLVILERCLAYKLFPYHEPRTLDKWQQGLVMPGLTFRRQKLELAEILLLRTDCMVVLSRLDKDLDLLAQAMESLSLATAMLKFAQELVPEKVSGLRNRAVQIATMAADILPRMPQEKVTELLDIYNINCNDCSSRSDQLARLLPVLRLPIKVSSGGSKVEAIEDPFHSHVVPTLQRPNELMSAYMQRIFHRLVLLLPHKLLKELGVPCKKANSQNACMSYVASWVTAKPVVYDAAGNPVAHPADSGSGEHPVNRIKRRPLADRLGGDDDILADPRIQALDARALHAYDFAKDKVACREKQRQDMQDYEGSFDDQNGVDLTRRPPNPLDMATLIDQLLLSDSPDWPSLLHQFDSFITASTLNHQLNPGGGGAEDEDCQLYFDDVIFTTGGKHANQRFWQEGREFRRTHDSDTDEHCCHGHHKQGGGHGWGSGNLPGSRGNMSRLSSIPFRHLLQTQDDRQMSDKQLQEQLAKLAEGGGVSRDDPLVPITLGVCTVLLFGIYLVLKHRKRLGKVFASFKEKPVTAVMLATERRSQSSEPAALPESKRKRMIAAALRNAMTSGNIENLQKAIQEAEALGLDEPTVHRANLMLIQKRKKEKERHAQQLAKEKAMKKEQSRKQHNRSSSAQRSRSTSQDAREAEDESTRRKNTGWNWFQSLMPWSYNNANKQEDCAEDDTESRDGSPCSPSGDTASRPASRSTSSELSSMDLEGPLDLINGMGANLYIPSQRNEGGDTASSGGLSPMASWVQVEPSDPLEELTEEEGGWVENKKKKKGKMPPATACNNAQPVVGTHKAAKASGPVLKVTPAPSARVGVTSATRASIRPGSRGPSVKPNIAVLPVGAPYLPPTSPQAVPAPSKQGSWLGWFTGPTRGSIPPPPPPPPPPRPVQRPTSSLVPPKVVPIDENAAMPMGTAAPTAAQKLQHSPGARPYKQSLMKGLAPAVPVAPAPQLSKKTLSPNAKAFMPSGLSRMWDTLGEAPGPLGSSPKTGFIGALGHLMRRRDTIEKEVQKRSAQGQALEDVDAGMPYMYMPPPPPPPRKSMLDPVAPNTPTPATPNSLSLSDPLNDGIFLSPITYPGDLGTMDGGALAYNDFQWFTSPQQPGLEAGGLLANMEDLGVGVPYPEGIDVNSFLSPLLSPSDPVASPPLVKGPSLLAGNIPATSTALPYGVFGSGTHNMWAPASTGLDMGAADTGAQGWSAPLSFTGLGLEGGADWGTATRTEPEAAPGHAADGLHSVASNLSLINLDDMPGWVSSVVDDDATTA